VSTVAVFGSGKVPEGHLVYERARSLGRELARAGEVVLTGGYGGVMEAVSRGSAENGGKTIGVTVADWGKANAWVGEERRAVDLLQRLRMLRDAADAFIVLPGGSGTLLEVAWVIESLLKGLTAPKPLVFFGDFWKPAVDLALSEPGPDPRFPFVDADSVARRCLCYAGTPDGVVRLVRRRLSGEASASGKRSTLVP
jgi:uncharacterized protein (TIGR00730 family)